MVCPNCGVEEHLTGERHGEVIRVTCSACNLIWDRDPSLRCPACAGADMRPVPQAVWEKARGNQLTTVALRTVYLCSSCDVDRLRSHLDSGSPVPPEAGGR